MNPTGSIVIKDEKSITEEDEYDSKMRSEDIVKLWEDKEISTIDLCRIFNIE